MATKLKETERQLQYEALKPLVESKMTYFVRCSDCERTYGEWPNEYLAADWAAERGWRVLGERVICPICAPRYPQE